MNARWRALAREATSAAEHIAFGVTVLGRANYAQDAYYAQAFFSLSIGFERTGKISFLVDHALENAGTFPSSDTLKNYGHNLRRLLSQMEEIARRRGMDERLPSSAIHSGIIETLSEFATNVTRYYNLEVVAGARNTPKREDPIATWFHRVTTPILNVHYHERYREKNEHEARLIDELIREFTRVRHHAETGERIDSPFDGARRTAATQFAKRWERMYVLQIARFVSSVLSGLGYAATAQQLPDVPYFPEIFAIFQNEDAYFRNRKTWSIY